MSAATALVPTAAATTATAAEAAAAAAAAAGPARLLHRGALLQVHLLAGHHLAVVELLPFCHSWEGRQRQLRGTDVHAIPQMERKRKPGRLAPVQRRGARAAGGAAYGERPCRGWAARGGAGHARGGCTPASPECIEGSVQIAAHRFVDVGGRALPQLNQLAVGPAGEVGRQGGGHGGPRQWQRCGRLLSMPR